MIIYLLFVIVSASNQSSSLSLSGENSFGKEVLSEAGAAEFRMCSESFCVMLIDF
jgi:hypothetical protein